MKLQVGQKLWWVPNHGCFGSPREVTISKVGRKYATIDRGAQIDIETLLQKPQRGYSSIGKCHLSREVWEAERKLFSTWQNFHRRLCHTPPANITLDDILATAARWGIELRKEGSKT